MNRAKRRSLSSRAARWRRLVSLSRAPARGRPRCPKRPAARRPDSGRRTAAGGSSPATRTPRRSDPLGSTIATTAAFSMGPAGTSTSASRTSRGSAPLERLGHAPRAPVRQREARRQPPGPHAWSRLAARTAPPGEAGRWRRREDLPGCVPGSPRTPWRPPPASGRRGRRSPATPAARARGVRRGASCGRFRWTRFPGSSAGAARPRASPRDLGPAGVWGSLPVSGRATVSGSIGGTSAGTGRRTTNRAPRPGPSLEAKALPPWSSARWPTIVRPTPRLAGTRGAT